MDYEYTAWLKANEERKYHECDPVEEVEETEEEDYYDKVHRNLC